MMTVTTTTGVATTAMAVTTVAAALVTLKAVVGQTMWLSLSKVMLVMH
jgi:hypothetical protein